uniref:Ig-like domain-containing protein n=1 Tax=Naja naja TaxID=35670 RepID=A0A8C6XWF2_NAJNA
ALAVKGLPSLLLFFLGGSFQKVFVIHYLLTFSQILLRDSDVILECEALGTPPLEVYWLKDNKPVRSSRKHRIITEKSLFSLQLQGSDSGSYTCEATNEAGENQSRNDAGSKSCSTELKVKG